MAIHDWPDCAGKRMDEYKKEVSMIRKYHNHTLQTKPQDHEGEPDCTNSYKTSTERYEQYMYTKTKF